MRDSGKSKSKDHMIIVLLLLGIAAVAYYFLFFQPLNSSVNAAISEQADIQNELEVVQMNVLSLQSMQEEIDRLSNEENVSRVYSYNNMKAELSELNDILSTTKSYAISFSDLTQEDLLIRRNFELSFITSSYEEAKNIAIQLNNSQYRCLLGDVSFSSSERDTSMDLMATFFETMYDGVADSGLPEEITDDYAEEIIE